MVDLLFKKFLNINPKLPKSVFTFIVDNCRVAVKNLSLFDLILFPFRDFWLKLSYFFKKHDSVEKLKRNVGFLNMLYLLTKAYTNAFLLFPKMIVKRYKIQKSGKLTIKNKANLIF